MFKELTLFTCDLEKSKKFYQEKLKFSIEKETKNSVAFRISDFTLLCLKYTEDQVVPNHFAFNVPRGTLEDYMSKYQNDLDWIEKDSQAIFDLDCWGEMSLYFFDDNSNLLEFVTRENCTKFALGEVGVVLENIEGKVEKIMQVLGMQFYNKRCTNSKFITIGDHNGICLMVEKGKTWFPVELIASPSKFKCVYSSDEGDHFITSELDGRFVIKDEKGNIQFESSSRNK